MKAAKGGIFAVSAVILIVVACLSYEIAEPWNGWFDSAGAMHSRFARNFLTFGFLKTCFSPTWDQGSVLPDRFDHYLHHPPLVDYMVAASFKIFGMHEWGARAVPVAFSAVALLALYIAVKKIYGRHTALLSVIFMGFTPMFLYYGRMVNHEVIFLAFYLLTLYFYICFTKTRKPAYLAGLSVSSLLAYMTAWPAFYLSAILLAHYLFFQYARARDRRPVLIFILMPVLFAALYAAWFYYIKGSFEDIALAFLHRARPSAAYSFTWRDYLSTQAYNFTSLFTVSLCALAVFYLFSAVRKGRKDLFSGAGVEWLFLILASAHVIIFRQGVQEHAFWLFYFLPFFGVACARAALFVSERFRATRLLPVIALCFMALFLRESYFTVRLLHEFEFDIGLESLKAINSATIPSEEIGTNFPVSVPGGWYLNRKHTVIGSVNGFRDIISRKDLALVVLSPDKDRELENFLSDKYPSSRRNGLIYYEL